MIDNERINVHVLHLKVNNQQYRVSRKKVRKVNDCDYEGFKIYHIIIISCKKQTLRNLLHEFSGPKTSRHGLYRPERYFLGYLLRRLLTLKWRCVRYCLPIAFKFSILVALIVEYYLALLVDHAKLLCSELREITSWNQMIVFLQEIAHTWQDFIQNRSISE